MDFVLVEMAKTIQVMELIQFPLLNMFSPNIIKKNYNKGVHHVMSENNFRLYHHVQMVTNLLLPKYKFLKTVSY